MTKVTIQVTLGSNETALVEVPIKDVREWDHNVLPVLRKLEERVGDRSRRILAANVQLRELGQRDPEAANLVRNLVLLSLGQYPTADVIGFSDEHPNNVQALKRVDEPEA